MIEIVEMTLSYEEGYEPLLLFRPDVSTASIEKARQVLSRLFAPSHVAEHVRNGRRKLPETRQALVHKFEISGFEGYVIVGEYGDGSPGEVFIIGSKEGSTIRGLLDSLGMMLSFALQYGIPLEDLARKMVGTRFEPAGRTKNNEIPTAASIVDYLFRFLIRRYAPSESQSVASGNLCPEEGCGAALIYEEGCHKCHACGYSSC